MKKRLYYFVLCLFGCPFIAGICLFFALFALIFPIIALINPDKIEKWTEEE